jgi:hypothetical protein
MATKPAAKKTAARKPAAKKTTVQVNRQRSQNDSSPVEATQPNEQAESPEREALTPYEPKHRPLSNAGLDQQAAHEERQAELQAERDEHNRRTGDSSR